MKLDAKNTYRILLALVGVALLVLAVVVYTASGFLQKKSKDVSQGLLRNMVVEERQNMLRKASADIQKYKPLSQIAQSIVPQDKDQARSVLEISKLASDHHLVIGAITFPASSLGDPKTQQTQIQPAEGIPGVYVLPVTVKSDSKVPSNYSDFLQFLDALEHNRRTALVTSIALEPDENNASKLFFTLTIDEYVKP